jgi:hypothetical protein
METCDRRVVRANAPGGGPLSSPPLPLPAASIGGTFLYWSMGSACAINGEARDTWGSREGGQRHTQDSHGGFSVLQKALVAVQARDDLSSFPASSMGCVETPIADHLFLANVAWEYV